MAEVHSAFAAEWESQGEPVVAVVDPVGCTPPSRRSGSLKLADTWCLLRGVEGALRLRGGVGVSRVGSGRHSVLLGRVHSAFAAEWESQAGKQGRPLVRQQCALRLRGGVGVSSRAVTGYDGTTECALRLRGGVGVSSAQTGVQSSGLSGVHSAFAAEWESQAISPAVRSEVENVHSAFAAEWESQAAVPPPRGSSQALCTPPSRRSGSLKSCDGEPVGDDAGCTPPSRRSGSLKPRHWLGRGKRTRVHSAFAAEWESQEASKSSRVAQQRCTPPSRRSGSLKSLLFATWLLRSGVHSAFAAEWESQGEVGAELALLGERALRLRGGVGVSRIARLALPQAPSGALRLRGGVGVSSRQGRA